MAMVLAHELVTESAPVDRWMLFLHGIWGRRANWRSLARRWVALRAQGDPGWGAVLVDLREHGESQGLPGPPTVAAAGADLVPLAAALTEAHGGRVAGILGHSFGGKVAIAGAEALRGAGSGLDELWIIDSAPGLREQPRDRSVERVFELLEQLPERFAARAEFVDQLVRGGLAKGVAQWLATNLVEAEDGAWRFGLDLDRIRALLDDYAADDRWPTLEAELDAGTRVGLVLGGESEAVFGDQRERAEALVAAGRLALTVIPGAGHWVHVDSPDALLDVLGEPLK